MITSVQAFGSAKLLRMPAGCVVEKSRAERFAKILLDENRHEVVFEVELGHSNSTAAIVKALRDLGCEVEELGTSRIRVSCEGVLEK